MFGGVPQSWSLQPPIQARAHDRTRARARSATTFRLLPYHRSLQKCHQLLHHSCQLRRDHSRPRPPPFHPARPPPFHPVMPIHQLLALVDLTLPPCFLAATPPSLAWVSLPESVPAFW